MDYLERITQYLPPLNKQQLPAIALGLSTAALLTYALKPRYEAERAPCTLPGLSNVPPSYAKDLALHLYPVDYFEGGQWVNLPYGRTRVWIMGPEDGQKVVLVHGFQVPAIVLKDMATHLVGAGFRVLTYDLYGRGHSDYVDLPYSATLFSTQLALVLQAVGWTKPALVGYSMGGSIVTAFADQFPHVAGEHIVLLASAGLQKPGEFALRNRLMTSRLGMAIVSSSVFRWFANLIVGPRSSPSLPPIPQDTAKRTEIINLQTVVLPGYMRALASSVMYGPMCNQRQSFIELSSRKVLIICGTEDTSCPIRMSEEINQLAKGSKLVAIKKGSHFIPVTHTDQVAGAIASFLRE
ncbi:alpha/beta-hydrolase [Calocera cornea HHB12733]|uniref:Alpha/beta-hydrolase n=1 Tax=Calocera cornea HHB12733 TaxID=1353952 RepID=A0A165CGD0_9BASI|nr:alpha/beta-hydrolase [Calocera cornea HHB12733]